MCSRSRIRLACASPKKRHDSSAEYPKCSAMPSVSRMATRPAAVSNSDLRTTLVTVSKASAPRPPVNAASASCVDAPMSTSLMCGVPYCAMVPANRRVSSNPKMHAMLLIATAAISVLTNTPLDRVSRTIATIVAGAVEIAIVPNTRAKPSSIVGNSISAPATAATTKTTSNSSSSASRPNALRSRRTLR